MVDLPWVMLGCALGGLARFWLSNVVDRRVGAAFPWGTLLVNVSGALMIGVAAGAASLGSNVPADVSVWRLAVVGFLGSYTTVSSFSLHTLALVQAGHAGRAVGNVVLSLGLCIGAAGLGMLSVATITGSP